MITFDDFWFTYPNSEKAALANISFSIAEGDFVLVAGASGSGKSTLLRQLKPSLRPFGQRQGKILLGEQAIDELGQMEETSRIGFVGQNPREQIVTDKVYHELAFGMENLGLPLAIMHRRMAEVCEFFGISQWYERETAYLSGGEAQLLNLAAVMAMEPDILLLDEPTSQLDPIAASNFLTMLRKIHEELGTTIVIVEHHLEEVYAMADRVFVLEEGHLLAQGSTMEVARFLVDHKTALEEGMPTAYRIAKGLGEQEEFPLTIGQGKQWLRRQVGKGQKPIEQRLEKKKPADTVVELSYIKAGYDSRDVLKDASLRVFEGEWFALLGGNGSGKSTLLKLLTGELEAKSGGIKIFGKKIKKRQDLPLGYGQMVLLPQDPKALFTEITVEEELLESLAEIEELSLQEKEQAVEDMLASLHLKEYRSRHPYDLSGGQQQILALGKLLLLKPAVILLDEPTKGLDPSWKMELGSLLDNLRRSGVTIFMVSHDMEFAARYAERCGILFAGELVAVEDKRDFFAGNRFFTTAANRMAKEIAPRALFADEVVMLCKE